MRSLPISCTLDHDDYSERLAWIGRLNGESLRSFHQDGLALMLQYEPGAADDVRDLVRRESECCAFLSFTVTETAESIRLRIEAPAEALDAGNTHVDALFAPFLPGS